MAANNEYPARKVYIDAAGHERELHYSQSRHSGEWYPIYSLSECTDTCRLHGPDSEGDDYAGESWEYDY